MSFLVQGHCCHKRRLACRAPTPFATTALATPVDIIELNDALMGCLSSDSFMACSSLCLSIQAVSYYSLLETAKANQLEPSAYINYVLARIGEADSLEKLEALLPWNVALEPISKKVVQYNEGK